MDTFAIHGDVIADYRRYIASFILIRDEAIEAKVRSELERGRLWPEPLIQFNPSFKTAGFVRQLVDQRRLRPELPAVIDLAGGMDAWNAAGKPTIVPVAAS